MPDPDVVEHRLSLADFAAQVRDDFDAPLWLAWLRNGPFRAYAVDGTDDGPAHVYCWHAATSHTLRVHEYGHTPAGGDHDHEPWLAFDVMSRYPPRLADRHDLSPAYIDARETGALEIRHEM